MATRRSGNRVSRFSTRPVEPVYFAGRTDQVKAIIRGGLDPAGGRLFNVSGPDKIGRTSLLHYVQWLARWCYATRRSGSSGPENLQEMLRVRGVRLVAPYVNLKLIDSRVAEVASQNSPDAVRAAVERTLASEIDREIRHATGEPQSTDRDGVALHEILDRMLSVQDDWRVMLMMDHAERLLDVRLLTAVRDFLATLNDSVRGFGLVLAFGVSGELGGEDSFRRAKQIESLVNETSSFLSMVADHIGLGLLDDEEIRGFLALDTFPGENAFAIQEQDWLLDVAGGHPYLLNLAAQQLWQETQRGADGSQRDRAMATIRPRIESFTNAGLARVSAAVGATTLTRMLPSLAVADVATPLDDFRPAAEALAGEGLLVAHGDRWRVPSTLVRNALRESLLKPGWVPQVHTRDVEAQVVVMVGTMTVPLDLTPMELRLLEQLVLVGDHGLAGKGVLLEALWDVPQASPGSPPDRRSEMRLTQRLSTLRKKLMSALGEDPIVNVYGEGYRLRDPERFKVRTAP